MKDSDLRERTISTEEIYHGRMITLEKLAVELPNGRVATREIVRHPGAVAILAEPEPDTILLLRQFRKPTEDILIEIPAGKLEAGEDPLACAHRELAEETGYRADSMQPLFSFYTSPGFADEQLHVFYATALTVGDMQLDEDEFLLVEAVKRHDILTLVTGGKIRDAKTLVALLWWLNQER